MNSNTNLTGCISRYNNCKRSSGSTTIAAVLLNKTVFSDNMVLKLLPEIVTDAPGNPLKEEIPVIAGDMNTVKSS